LDGARLEQNAWVTADTVEVLNFSDGSEIAVAAGGRARIAELDERGLRVTLEAGKLEASITPQTGYRWVVQAGPHTVTVIGTVFSVEWSAEQARLQVAVKRGRVQVESNDGSPSGGNAAARVLEAGESLRVEPPSFAAVAEPPALQEEQKSVGAPSSMLERTARGYNGHASESSGFDEPSNATDPRAIPTLTPSASIHPSPRTDAAPSTWKQLAEAGRYAEAVSAARGVGLSTLLSSTGATDLMLLADAARLGKAPELAQQVLLTIRERHPNHPNATVAAFALGRLAFEVKRDDGSAVRWFQTYLAASPNGSMAEGARGRLLRVWLRLGEKAKARAAAVEYLQHHPKGHHASVAQSLLGD
jgi:hypothetical protein